MMSSTFVCIELKQKLAVFIVLLFHILLIDKVLSCKKAKEICKINV